MPTRGVPANFVNIAFASRPRAANLNRSVKKSPHYTPRVTTYINFNPKFTYKTSQSHSLKLNLMTVA